jgi:hypothetical protein
MEIAAVIMLGPLEHQVLEQMCKTGAARLLVFRSDVIPDVDRDDRTVPILVDEHIETIVEGMANERDVHRTSSEVTPGSYWQFHPW